MQNVEEKRPMREDSIFQIMSMTKPITAVGIMMLCAQRWQSHSRRKSDPGRRPGRLPQRLEISGTGIRPVLYCRRHLAFLPDDPESRDLERHSHSFSCNY